jgi:AcrR family transcriptional regulator
MPNSAKSKRARAHSLPAKSDSRQFHENVEKNDVNSTKDGILDAAEEEFAERGIAGARVEQIALRAGVAKALIYYYFEGKQQLLQAIVDRTLAENVTLKRSAIKAGSGKRDSIDVLLDAGMEFMKKKKNVLRIFLLELLKKEDTDISMLQVMDSLFAGVEEFGPSLPGLDNLALERLRLPLFFFGSLPFCLFFLMEDKWAEHYKIGKAALEKRFFESSKRAFESYLKPLLSGQAKDAGD